LHDRDADVRRTAAGVLAELGPKAKAAVPDLIATLKDENSQVHARVTKAVDRVMIGGIPSDLAQGAPGSAGRASGSQAGRKIPVVQAER